jgi:hypothetical protein
MTLPFLRWSSRPSHAANVAGHPAGLGEGAPEQELDTGAGAAQLVGRSARERVVDGRVEAEQHLAALAARSRAASRACSPARSPAGALVSGHATRPSLAERAAVDDGLGLPITGQDDKQAGDHGGPAPCPLGISTVKISPPACDHRYIK